MLWGTSRNYKQCQAATGEKAYNKIVICTSHKWLYLAAIMLNPERATNDGCYSWLLLPLLPPPLLLI